MEPCPLCKQEVCACDKKDENGLEITAIDAELLQKKMTESASDLVVINVLSEEYYNDCHIKGSINIPLFNLKDKAQALDKNKKIIVYCTNKMCTASSAAFKILKELGFEHVFAYEGGMADWHKRNFPTKGACSLPYLEQQSMSKNKKEYYLKGFILSAIVSLVAALCCFTPLLSVLLALIGLTAILAYADYIFLPVLVLSVLAMIYFFLKWQRSL